MKIKVWKSKDGRLHSKELSFSAAFRPFLGKGYVRDDFFHIHHEDGTVELVSIKPEPEKGE